MGEVLDQPAFLNAAVRCAPTLGPEAVLEASKAIERDLGREAGGRRHAPA